MGGLLTALYHTSHPDKVEHHDCSGAVQFHVYNLHTGERIEYLSNFVPASSPHKFLSIQDAEDAEAKSQGRAPRVVQIFRVKTEGYGGGCHKHCWVCLHDAECGSMLLCSKSFKCNCKHCEF